MAEGRSILRIIRAVFDRSAAKKVEAEMEASLAQAGAKGGKKSGDNFVRELRDAFNKRKAQLSEQLARGTIDQKEFKKQTDIAAKTFNDGLLKGIEEARRRGELTDREYTKLTRSIKRVGDAGERDIGQRLVGALKRAAAAAAVLFGIRQIQRFARESVQAFEALRTGQRQLEGQLRNTGIAWSDVSDEVRQHARELWDTHRLTQGEVNQTLRQLVLVTGDYEKSLKMVGLAHDLMAATGLNAERASRLLGRALNGELTALNRYGIQLSANRDVAEQLTERLQGQARAATSNADTWRKAMGDLRETIGGLITAAFGLDEGFSVAAEAVRKLNDALTENMDGWVRFGRLTIATIRTTVNVVNIGLQAIEAALTAMIASVMAALNLLPASVDFVIRQLNRLPGINIDVTMGRLPADQWFERMNTAHERAQRSVHAIADAWRAVGREAAKAGEAQPIALTDTGEDGPAAGPARAEAIDREAEAAARLEEQREALIAQMSREIEVQGRRAAAYLEGEEAVEALNRELAIQDTLLRAGVEEGDKHYETFKLLAEGQYDAARAAESAAAQFETAWTEAHEAIEEQARATTTAMFGLFTAWATGGIGSVARLAKVKVVENIAAAAENLARAFGWLGLGNIASVAAHKAAAAQHAKAATLWGVAGAAAGAGAGGGGGAGAGAATGIAGPSTGPAQRAQPMGPDITINLVGPGWDAMNPAIQDVVFGAQQEARARFGADAKVRINRRTA